MNSIPAPIWGISSSYKDMDACLRGRHPGSAGAGGVGGCRCCGIRMKKFGTNLAGGFDVALPVVHGTNVEDGTLMGQLEMLGVPYAACDVASSAARDG